MSDEEDPEVIADLRLRASSVYDSSRTRAVDVNQLWQRPTFVTEWRCRFPGQNAAGPCRVMIPVDADTVERLALFNAELDKRNEPPIQTHEVMVCDAHRSLLADYRARKLPELQAELRDAIQQLKKSDKPREEKALIEILHKRHHPDIEGLLLCLEEKLGGKNKRRSL